MRFWIEGGVNMLDPRVSQVANVGPFRAATLSSSHLRHPPEISDTEMERYGLQIPDSRAYTIHLTLN